MTDDVNGFDAQVIHMLKGIVLSNSRLANKISGQGLTSDCSNIWKYNSAYVEFLIWALPYPISR